MTEKEMKSLRERIEDIHAEDISWKVAVLDEFRRTTVVMDEYIWRLEQSCKDVISGASASCRAKELDLKYMCDNCKVAEELNKFRNLLDNKGGKK